MLKDIICKTIRNILSVELCGCDLLICVKDCGQPDVRRRPSRSDDKKTTRSAAIRRLTFVVQQMSSHRHVLFS